ncbi:LSU ribosomal protein L14E [Thermovirga lienii DSM 17291]|uniref:LSU ribosomal protein L14E n=1 Tax=Thermovirga lienii (strain ATCC BAA-1197 / DSM 17291 / Cas60314) TaxID=580340 RepID=G7V8W3_THELD|nr:LSU ribosomal protein L14E [Thermovirga lienii DSM 17291]
MGVMGLGRLKIGQVVISKQGKDTGKWYVVVGYDERSGFVLVADGKKRTSANPKRKNPKHLQPTGMFIKEVAEMVEGRKCLADNQLLSLIESCRNEETTCGKVTGSYA